MPAKKSPSKSPSKPKHYRHKSADRANLPTEQTSRYMETADRQAVTYRPTLRSLEGPALSWDRDAALDEITTPATPLYIHEKVHPAAFVESLGSRNSEATLFEDFNNLPENAAFEWYAYRGNWQNRIVRGEARHVMASLLKKEGLAGKVQMIYFDPPYGISFKSNMQATTTDRNVGENDRDIPGDQGTIQAFRDTYRNGIHSYLDNVYRILVHGRELLSESGSFFLQIGPENVHRLATLFDEIYGPENKVATIPFAKSGGTSSGTLPNSTDYLLWYAKDKDKLKYWQLYENLNRKEKIAHMSSYAMVELADGTTRKLTKEEEENPDQNLPNGSRLYSRMGLVSPGHSTTGRSDPYVWNGTEFPCPPGAQWRVSPEGLDRLAELGRLDAAGSETLLRWKRYEEEVPGRQITNLWHRQMSANDLHYVVETAESVIERCILMSTDPGDLVLDPTCGSGTTAYTAEKWGRRWITTDCSAVAVSLARQRLSTGVFDYYLLQDSLEGARKEAELSSKSLNDVLTGGYEDDPAKGFVYERVPTVSAAVLAYDKAAEPTLLVNHPFKKRNTIRVCSPFTVESHSPHRHIDAASILSESDEERQEHNFNARTAIIEALKVAGFKEGTASVQVDDITDYPANDKVASITHMARVRDTKAAIVIVPDDRTVSKQLIDHVAEQATNIPSVTMLLVVGFGFEPEVRSGENERRGRLDITKLQANRDLQVGNLEDKNTDNAFVRIGEPEIEILDAPDNEITIKVLGHDTYDPATGQITQGDAHSIDCWMIDTNYDGRSFFAHRIHFPGKGDDPQLKRFKKRLGKRISPDLWKAMLSTQSAPFPRPKTGRIAVRIVTTTHTEMTTVREVPTANS